MAVMGRTGWRGAGVEARLVKATVFPVAMCGGESWTIKKAEC